MEIKRRPETSINFKHLTERKNPEAQISNNSIPFY